MTDEIRQALDLTFVSAEAAIVWMERPNSYLHGRTPNQAVEDGHPERVMAALEAINSGFAS